ncbi:MAG TPA: RHS repeat-associated core domain-containing protein, partial [Thermoanaerobaculia bacterium]
HLDHLGTPRLITDERGYRLSENAYYPFGLDQTPWNQEIENFSNRKIDNQKFTGHERDYIDSWHVWPQESLDYMHARFYSAASGRFLSVDPVLNLKRALREPQNWNRYAYVMNNPLRYTDPDGRDHYQEPGFTKPYSEWGEALQMDENTPAVVRYSNYATGGLTALGAAGFVGVGSAATEGALQLAARFPNAFGFLLRTGVAITAGVGYGNSQEIRFTQGSIKSTFKDGRTVAGMIEGLKNGSVKPGDVAPIRVFMRDGKMFTLDNRRLYAFQQAGVKSIRVVWATAQELARELPKKLTTENDGVSAVVRGQ